MQIAGDDSFLFLNELYPSRGLFRKEDRRGQGRFKRDQDRAVLERNSPVPICNFCLQGRL